MFHVVKPDIAIDFMGKRGTFTIVSIVLVVMAIVVTFGVGLKFGLDFSGGHEVLLEFEQTPTANDVRNAVNGANLGDTSVQSFEIPDSGKTYYLVRVQRAETVGADELKKVEAGLKQSFAEKFQSITYDPERGNVLDVNLAGTSTNATTSATVAIAASIKGSGVGVWKVKEIMGRSDTSVYQVTLRGVDTKLVSATQSLDPSVKAVRVDFVGPTVGEQLRNDGILAILYALLCILIYIALRFDFFFGPGAIVTLLHDAVITVGVLGLIGHEFSLATIAGLLTLVGYSINDTIVVFDRIRETAAKVHGKGLSEILNRAINETLARTLMTSLTTFLACICLMVFGRGTILFDFGLIMAIGVVIGTYSSIYVASPVFMALRARFGPRDMRGKGKGRTGPKASSKTATNP